MCSLVESGPRQAMNINTHINTEPTWLTGMAGLALPVVGTLAVEVVHQVDAAPTILTRVVSALIDIWGRRKIYMIQSLPNCVLFRANKRRTERADGLPPGTTSCLKMLHSLRSQSRPSQPSGQKHWKEFTASMQVPPFPQGLLMQSLISGKVRGKGVQYLTLHFSGKTPTFFNGLLNLVSLF